FLHPRGDRRRGPLGGPGARRRRAAAGRGAPAHALGPHSRPRAALHAGRGRGPAMNQFVQGIHWIFTASHWDTVNFQTGIRAQLAYHVELSALSLLFAACLAIPVGLLVGHKRRGQFLAVSVANVGRAVPSFAVLVLVFVFMLHYAQSIAFGFGPGVVALTLLAIPPVLTNTYVGIQNVDRDLIEAARGMGF